MVEEKRNILVGCVYMSIPPLFLLPVPRLFYQFHQKP